MTEPIKDYKEFEKADTSFTNQNAQDSNQADEDETNLAEILPEYEARLQDLEDNLFSYNGDYNPKKFNDETKSLIAQRFVKWYFLILSAAMGVVLIYNLLVAIITTSGDLTINLQDIILAISTAIGTPLGFIIGYYFKDSEEKV